MDISADEQKRLEYEALIYDCSPLIKNLPDKMPNGSRLKSFGFIINSDCSLKGWSISESGEDTKHNRYSLDKNKKDSWLDTVLEKKKEKKIEEKKIAVKKQAEKNRLILDLKV